MSHAVIRESGRTGDGDEPVRYVAESTRGFALTLAGLEAFLEHGIKLNLVADKNPDAHVKGWRPAGRSSTDAALHGPGGASCDSKPTLKMILEKKDVPRKANMRPGELVPGGVDEYLAKCPQDVQARLTDIRAAIQAAAPGSTETVSYFQMPGYFYEGYDYNGMFAWFSYKKPHVRLHVRPPVLEDNRQDLGDYPRTKAIVSFPANGAIPKVLVKKLVKASIKVMKQKKQSA